MDLSSAPPDRTPGPMRMDPPFPALPILFLAVTAVSALLYHLTVPVILDDAYVYFRVAERFIETGRPVFNDGDGFSITTSPLWTLILTAVGVLLPSVPLVASAKAIFIALLAAASWLLFGMLRDRLPWVAAVSALPVFFAPPMTTLAGHDTALALCMGLGTIASFRHGSRWFPVWAALFYLARGEGAVLGALLGLLSLAMAAWDGRLAERIRGYLVPALIGGALVAAWHGFYLSLYGQLLPSTMGIKILQGEAGWTRFGEPWRDHIGLVHHAARDPLSNALGVVLAAVGAVALARVCWPLPLWPVLHFAVYAALGVAYYHWYYYPVDFLQTLLLVTGIGVLAELALRRLLRLPAWTAAAAAVTAAFLLVPVARTAATAVAEGRADQAFIDRRFEAYQELAGRMAEFAGRPDFTLLSHEIGIFGHLAPDAAVHDVVGLATPVQGREDLWNWEKRVAEFEPDLILWPYPDAPGLLTFGLMAPGGPVLFERVATPSNGLSFTLYGRRGKDDLPPAMAEAIAQIRTMLTGVEQAGAPVSLLETGDGLGLFLHAPSRVGIPVPRGADGVEIGFGYRADAWAGGNRPDGAVFSLRIPGREEPLFSRRLDPVAVPADRGVQKALVPFPAGTAVARIELEIGTGANGSWDWTYWRVPRWRIAGQLVGAPPPSDGACPALDEVLARQIPGSAGWVDHHQGRRYGGWAADLQAARPADLVVAVGRDRVLGCAGTGRNRRDVASATGIPELAAAGFELDLPADAPSKPSEGPAFFARLPDGRFQRLNVP